MIDLDEVKTDSIILDLDHHLTIERGHAVHVFWGVLEQSVPAVVVLDRVHWKRLKPPPANRQDKWVTCL